MSFKKWYNFGYLMFAILVVTVYFTVPPNYGVYVLVALGILFGLYEFILRRKTKKAHNNSNKNLS
ncbi:hypothetical protein CU633_07925 [Bacillus sp. V3-13]|uniref:hypothetical protein n=1 Tax=Bacillus sp. V3-13 TaxID=2053728 RepID=UPI000C78E327|nr:hypothetical protein [Bacillus sp. V3-13]PLR77945.1 hypothetical protein CU633_07925 [Bacillus sp. V3-13]